MIPIGRYSRGTTYISFDQLIRSIAPQAELENLLREKNKELPQKEARILSIIENKEKLSNSKSHLTVRVWNC